MSDPRTVPPPAGGDTPEPRPPLGSWWRMYAAVLLHLVFWIAVFYLFTERFAVSQ